MTPKDHEESASHNAQFVLRILIDIQNIVLYVLVHMHSSPRLKIQLTLQMDIHETFTPLIVLYHKKWKKKSHGTNLLKSISMTIKNHHCIIDHILSTPVVLLVWSCLYSKYECSHQAMRNIHWNRNKHCSCLHWNIHAYHAYVYLFLLSPLLSKSYEQLVAHPSHQVVFIPLPLNKGYTGRMEIAWMMIWRSSFPAGAFGRPKHSDDLNLH
jgi:hypothetical protein